MRGKMMKFVKQLQNEILEAEDAQIPEAIIQSFLALWFKSTQKESSDIHMDAFAGVYKCLADTFRPDEEDSKEECICKSISKDPVMVILYCEICDEEFPLLDNDKELTITTHSLSPSHMKVWKDLKAALKPRPPSAFEGKLPSASQCKQIIDPIKMSIHVKYRSNGIGLVMDDNVPIPYCIYCDVWLKPKISMDVEVLMRTHVEGRKHQFEARQASKIGSVARSRTRQSSCHPKAPVASRGRGKATNRFQNYHNRAYDDGHYVDEYGYDSGNDYHSLDYDDPNYDNSGPSQRSYNNSRSSGRSSFSSYMGGYSK